MQYRHNYTGQFVMVGCKHLCCAHLKGVLYFGRSSRVPDSAVNIYIPPTLHVSWQEHRSSSFFPLTSQCSQRTKKTVSLLQRAIKNRHKHPHTHTAHKTKNNFLVLSFSFCVDDHMLSWRPQGRLHGCRRNESVKREYRKFVAVEAGSHLSFKCSEGVSVGRGCPLLRVLFEISIRTHKFERLHVD